MVKTSYSKVFVALASAFLLILPSTVVQANEPNASIQESSKIALPPSWELIRPISSVIVKYKAGVPAEQGGMVTGQSVVPQGVDLENPRAAGGGATVVELEQPVVLAEAEQIANALQNDPRVEWAEPNGWVFPSAYPASPPNDSDYDDLWGLWDTYGVRVGSSVTNMTPAWTTSRGDGIVVAVLDTGQIEHPDLDGNTLPGYDFVSSSVPGSAVCVLGGTPVELIRAVGMSLPNSNMDGDVLDTAGYGAVGRDSNPLDPGDWGRSYGCDLSGVVQSTFGSSTWHGTHVAGTVAAVTNNAVGVSGVAPNAKIVPVRVLGYGGGQESDIADAIRWAAGLEVPGVPINGNKRADVINMSLGGTGACPNSYQEAINAARAAGSIVVVAAGNEGQDVANVRPANCDGVISVAAINAAGTRSWYSNYGSGITIAAPGGAGGTGEDPGILSTYSSTATGPGYPGGETGYPDPVTAVPAPNYGSISGTSMATPHVAGVVALMLSAPGGPRSETAVRTLLQNTAQPFANDLVCDPLEPSKTCGAGIANAAAFTAPQLTGMSSNTSVPSGGASVVINGSNLASVTSLRFGDSTVAITSVTPTQITAIVPPNPAGTVAVTVRSVSGQSNRLTFTYADPAPPAPPAPAPDPVPVPAPVPAPVPTPPTTPLPNPDPSPVKPMQPNMVDVVRGLSPTQVQQLSGTELAQLTPQAFAVMTPAQVRALRPNQITPQISRASLRALSPEAVRAFQPRTLNAFRAWQIRALTPRQARELRPKQIASLGPLKRKIIASKRD